MVGFFLIRRARVASDYIKSSSQLASRSWLLVVAMFSSVKMSS